MKRRAGWIASWAVVTVLLAVSLGALDWSRALAVAAGAEPGWIVLALALNLSILLLWTAQWRGFLPRSVPVSLGRVFEVTSVMSTVANSVPFPAGQVTGLHLLATRGGTGHATALSVTTLDQLAEGVAKLSLLALLALATPLPEGLRRAVLGLVVGVGLLAVIVAVAAHRMRGRGAGRREGRRDASRLGEASGAEEADAAWAGGGASGAWQRLCAFLARWARHLEAVRDPRRLLTGIVLALAMKAAEGGAIWGVQQAVGVDLPWWAALLVLASVSVATMVSVAPGNLGVYEAAAFGAYRWLGVAPEAALALALLQHVAYLIPLAGTGWLVVATGGTDRVRVRAEDPLPGD